jgi:hypothetical protein
MGGGPHTNMKIVGATGSRFDLAEENARRLLGDLLARPLFAHLATVAEAEPRESPVWFLWEDEALWIIGNEKTDTFPKRIALEPRCAVGIVDFDASRGLVQHVGFRGHARREAHDKNRMTRLLTRYLGEVNGWDPRFLKILDDQEYIFIKFVPETAVVRDQSFAVLPSPHGD